MKLREMTRFTTLTDVRPSRVPDLHSTSRLLQLPAEIRLIILRKLLKCDEPIYSLGTTDDVKYLESIQRSAQLLRTCQLLHQEGLAILYTENILCIDFMDFDDDTGEGAMYICGILEMFLPMPEGLSTKEEELLPLIDYATPARATARDDTGVMMQSAETLIKHWKMLQRFRRYHIRVHYTTQQAVFSACRMLQNVVLDKDVKFTLHMADNDGAESDKTAVQMLQSCRLLRCSSIVFELQKFSLSPQPQPTQVEKTGDLIALITGTGQTHDTYSEWVETTKQLRLFLGEYEFDDYEDDFDEYFKAVQQAAMNYDHVAYKEKMRILLTKLKDDIIDLSEDRFATYDNDGDIEEERLRRDDQLVHLQTHFVSKVAH